MFTIHRYPNLRGIISPIQGCLCFFDCPLQVQALPSQWRRCGIDLVFKRTRHTTNVLFIFFCYVMRCKRFFSAIPHLSVELFPWMGNFVLPFLHPGPACSGIGQHYPMDKSPSIREGCQNVFKKQADNEQQVALELTPKAQVLEGPGIYCRDILKWCFQRFS